MLAYGGMYAETMVWAYDYDKRLRGDIEGQADGAKGSIREHMRMCELFHKFGSADEPKEDDG